VSITASLARLREEIAAACAAAGRDPSAITLVAVSKTHPADTVREAHAAGIRHFAENRAQELLAKASLLADLDISWHMVGSLQTNKVKLLLPCITLLHSLDRAELAQAVGRHASKGFRLPALVQVNTTGESTKSGVAPAEIDALVDSVRSVAAIELRGLMTIGPLDGTQAENRRAFALLRNLRDRQAARHPDLDFGILSMGMSDDFPEAILEGATHLRIGSRIFGERDWKGADAPSQPR
jgi:PLP dependent protein